MRDHRDQLEKLAHELVIKETLDDAEIRALFGWPGLKEEPSDYLAAKKGNALNAKRAEEARRQAEYEARMAKEASEKAKAEADGKPEEQA